MTKEFKVEAKDVKEAKNVKSPGTIKFSDWFTIKLQKHKKLRPHHYEMIFAFFKNNKLNEVEPASRFDEMLTKFGY